MKIGIKVQVDVTDGTHILRLSLNFCPFDRHDGHLIDVITGAAGALDPEWKVRFCHKFGKTRFPGMHKVLHMFVNFIELAAIQPKTFTIFTALQNDLIIADESDFIHSLISAPGTLFGLFPFPGDNVLGTEFDVTTAGRSKFIENPFVQPKASAMLANVIGDMVERCVDNVIGHLLLTVHTVHKYILLKIE
ncbi:MAG: hypothetical protein M1428_04695 [Deltaproteobacteria bacterium]|nr:hypothetical protein [Deltaproteobacteria bacterium]